MQQSVTENDTGILNPQKKKKTNQPQNNTTTQTKTKNLGTNTRSKSPDILTSKEYKVEMKVKVSELLC